MSRRLAIACAGAMALGAGCNTAVGNYFANRARDFGECFRVELAAGVGLGGGVRAAGIADVGLGGGVFSFPGIAWSYGELVLRGPDPLVFAPWPLTRDASGEAYYLVGHIRGPGRHSMERPRVLRSFSLLPGLWTWSKSLAIDNWIWGEIGDVTPNAASLTKRRRWARVHAFDCEATVFAGVIGVSVGFSPGEFGDFLLGWFGLDFAGDDRALPPPPDDG